MEYWPQFKPVSCNNFSLETVTEIAMCGESTADTRNIFHSKLNQNFILVWPEKSLSELGPLALAFVSRREKVPTALLVLLEANRSCL